MNYKIKTDKFEKFDKKMMGGSRELSLTFKYSEEFQKRKKELNSLKKEITHGDFVALTVIYSALPPKTSRYSFRKRIERLEDIPQKDTKAVTIGNETFFSIVYKITPHELEEFERDLDESIKDVVGQEGKQLPAESLKKLNSTKRNKIYLFRLMKRIKGTDADVKEIPTASFVKLYHFYDDTLEEIRNNGISFQIVDELNLIIGIEPDNYEKLFQTMPWIIARTDTAESLSVDLNQEIKNFPLDGNIPLPDSSPTLIGVIDTGYDKSSPFSSWVTEVCDTREHKSHQSDKSHGTSVSNLIVGHDLINPLDKDHLGFMKVKHFEMLGCNDYSTKATVSFQYAYTELEKIIANNTNIKIWNLSFGAEKIPWSTNISYLGLKLDELSSKYDCVFVIASGNSAELCGKSEESLHMPGDSINSLTTGSVNTINGMVERADYSSFGRILHSFKPEVAHFGGPSLESGSTFLVSEKNYLVPQLGTSFAAPKICRILCNYLMTNYSLKEAKAALICDTKQVRREINVPSVFGYIPYVDPDYKKNRFTLRATVTIKKKGEAIIEIIIPKSINKIVLASCYFAKPMPQLGDESSIVEMDARLVFYSPENDPINKKHYSNSRVAGKHSATKKFHVESVQRFTMQKYFPTKKREYNWDKLQEEQAGRKVGIRIERLDLYDVSDSKKYEFSFVADFYGSEDSIKEMYEHNEQIIDADIDIEVAKDFKQ